MVTAAFGSCHWSKPGAEVSCSQTASHILVPSTCGHNEEKSEVHLTVTYKQRDFNEESNNEKTYSPGIWADQLGSVCAAEGANQV